ncbi:MAG: hypothetical protein H0X27_07010 [Caulobacteraceae bacterium]|nr:hypothetical protein [Caulobacteraceae bacterium]
MRPLHVLGIVLILFSPSMAARARAQVGLSISADSDDRFRGLSLSDGKPVVSAAIAYDHVSGAYAGASVIGVGGPESDPRLLGYIGYAGWSARAGGGLAWDLGVTHARYTAPTRGGYAADYTEVYAGLVADSVSARLYYSPNYLGQGGRTLYVDLAGAVRPARRWRLFGHVGALTPLGGQAKLGGHGAYVDVRAGVAFEFKRCELRLAWTPIGPKPYYPSGYPEEGEGLVLGATYAF